MAKVRVKGINKFTKTFIKSFNKKLSKNIAIIQKTELENEIIATILSGKSPVKGKRFKDYNEQYAKREKDGRKKPVDLNQTGKMLDSLEVKQVRGKPGLLIRFKDKLAVIHDELGAGKSKVIRRLLPRKGESFKANIQRVIDKLLKNVVKRSTR